MKKFLFLAAFLLLAVLSAGEPKYIFLFIGDGMGPNQEKSGAAALRAVGTVDLAWDKFPVQGYLTTRSADKDVTDSAAGATALLCGVKTNNRSLGVDAKEKKIESIGEVARKHGRLVGIVTTAQLNDATPGGMYAHVATRYQVNDILLQLAAFKPDLICGHKPKQLPLVPFNAVKYMKENGMFTVDNDLAAFGALKKENMPVYVQFDLPDAREYDFVKQPDLPVMVQKAVELFEGAPNGFVIMAEGGRIDWACHHNDYPLMLHAMMEFSRAVEVAKSFMKRYPEDTLILVTADHETGGLKLDVESSALPSQVKSMVVAGQNGYEKECKIPGVSWTSKNHSAADVPFRAIGRGADRFAGIRDNTEVALTIKKIISE